MRRAVSRVAWVALAGVVACVPQQPAESTVTRRADGLASGVATSPMVASHVRGAAARLADGRVLVSGGWSPSGTLIDIYDPATGTWVAGPPSPAGYTDHDAFAVAGRVVLAGGTASSVQILDLATGTWTQVADAYREYAAAALLADGRVLVTGGTHLGVEVAGAALVDPVAVTLQPAGALLTPRDCHTAVTLADGRVLILGGRSGPAAYLASAELYDPQAGTFTAAASMATARSSATATLLQDGRVLVTGGWNGDALSSAEIYDPASNTWTPAGTMVHARQLHEAVLLPDGRVAIVGGLGLSFARTADVELFDPAMGGSFTVVTALSAPRYYESSVVLGSGQLLVAAGIVNNVYVTTAEIISFTSCTPASCGSLGASCGQLADGCGGVLSCGTCAAGMTCASNACVACSPTTCAAKGATCGPIADGCGGTLNCGSCGAGLACVGGACVCAPTTCAALGRSCGTVPDGCGATLSCGTCAAGSTCGADGVCVSASIAGFDPAWKAPRCPAGTGSCSSGTLLVGRASLEANQPNTIDGCADGTSGSFHSDESLDALRIVTVDGAPFAAGREVRVEADVWAYAGYSSDALDLYVAADARQPVWTRIATMVPSQAGAQSLTAFTTLPKGGATQAIRGVFRYGGSPTPCLPGSYNDHDDLLFSVAQPLDTTPPTVAITSPTAAYIAGDVVLAATASDDVGVVRVAFYDGDVVVANAFSAPWQASWNTRVMADGARTITAVAYDAAGNTASAARAVFIDNTKPTAQLVSPASGASVTGTATLTATASDSVGVVRVSFLDGATLLGTVTAPPWSMAWSTAGAAAGTHSLTALAFDAAGNAGTSPPVVVSVDTAAPPAGLAAYDSTRRAPVCASAGSSCDSGTLLVGRGSVGPELNAPNTLGGSCADDSAGTYHSDESLDRLKVSTVDGSPLAAGKTVRVEATVFVWGAGSDRLDLWSAANADSPAWTVVGTIAPTASGLQTLSATYVLPTGGLQALRGVFRYGGSPGTCVTGSFHDVDDLAFVVQ